METTSCAPRLRVCEMVRWPNPESTKDVGEQTVDLIEWIESLGHQAEYQPSEDGTLGSIVIDRVGRVNRDYPVVVWKHADYQFKIMTDAWFEKIYYTTTDHKQ